jgi:hypothetical protein
MIRVLKPGGYLIYSDFVYPGWMALMGQVVIKKLAGFPTREALDELIKKHQLAKIQLSSSWLNYEGVFQKKSSST